MESRDNLYIVRAVNIEQWNGLLKINGKKIYHML